MDSYKDRLAASLTAADCTDLQLAKALGISIQAVRKVAAGTTTAFTAENNSKAAKILKVDPDWLATGEGEMFSNKLWPFVLVSPQQILKLNPIHLKMVEKFALDLLESESQLNALVASVDTVVKGSRKVVTGTIDDRSSNGNRDTTQAKKRGAA